MRAFTICLFITGICSHSPAQTANRFDVVIDEIFSDPTPAVGLPAAEFLELQNLSGSPIDLFGWQIVDAGGTAAIKIHFVLLPDSFVILCSRAALPAYQGFGAAIGLSGFPTLNNDGQWIALHSPDGGTIHALSYDKSWYHNPLKSSGGWSLEMLDPRNPCGGRSNWLASVAPAGGTPGSLNSVNRSQPDTTGPSMLRTYTPDRQSVTVLFDEPLDSFSAAVAENYHMESLGTPALAEPMPPFFDSVRLQFASALEDGIVYRLSASGIRDCAGNPITQFDHQPAGLPGPAATGDLVINEILFNPPPNGYDYVEIYNRSHKIIDINRWALANRNSDGGLDHLSPLARGPRLIFPGDYLVFTEDPEWVPGHYLVKFPERILGLASLPSMPDDEGYLVLLNGEGDSVDALHYSHQWHFPLVADEEGVALERLDYSRPAGDPDNWSSAASTAGFGTPGYQNSEFHNGSLERSGLYLSPGTFSPDNDGFEDYCYLHYQMPGPGYAGNITVFDAAGRPVRYLLKNATFDIHGSVRWDGLDDSQHRLPMGIYILFAEIFNLKGEVRSYRLPVILAVKL